MGGSDVDLWERAFDIARSYRRPLAFPHRLAILSWLVASFVVWMLVARIGLPWARVSAGVGMGLGIFAVFVVGRWIRRRWREPERALFLALRGVDTTLGERARRAFSTYRRLKSPEPGRASGESPELAAVHLERVLDQVPLDSLRERGALVRKVRLALILPLLVVAIGVFWTQPLLLLEGVDVLFARKGVGPFPIAYTADVRVTAELPAYLDGTGKKRAVSPELTAVPQGSEIEIRVLPRFTGRKLLLTDGLQEIPLVSDGQGGFVARWMADEPAVLRVATRLGEVLLLDESATAVSPILDQAPRVRLSGAPARKKLEELDEIELDYTALDDHGITQIDLVIQSGQRVVREELARLDGRKMIYRGAYRLPPDHEVLRRAFLPVRIRVEARDGNTATGPSWGKSEALVLLPKPLGQDMAERHQNLRSFRAALTKYLADDVRAARLSRVEAEEFREAARGQLRAAFSELRAELFKSNQVPEHTLSFLEAQLEALTRKGAERSSSEAVLLAVDALIGDISEREAKQLSQDLGAAVEEIAVQAREIRHDSQNIIEGGLEDLVDGAEQGAAQLREVGVLGLDLGSVAQGDLARIRGTLAKKEYGRAEAAALHLAERLKRATPSFGSKGGAVESGVPQSGGSGEGSGEGAPSDAPAQFQELSQEVDQLAQESAEELSELERMLQEARRAAEADFDPGSELEDATDELMRALGRLPESASTPGGPRAEAASARGHGEAMVEALEARDLDEAVERGLDAQEALERAKKLFEQYSWMDSGGLEEASSALKRAIEEAQRAAEQLQKSEEGKMGGSLSERAARQREFSERAKDLARRGRRPEAPLPDASLEALERAARLMQEAAQEMDAGRAEQGAARATEAQAELESALPEPGEGERGSEGGEAGEGDATTGEASVPEEEKDRARDFRERVEKGLGRGAGRLSPAVRRYADELK